MGATPAQIAKLRRKIAAEIEKDRPVILPENQTAYQAFLSINDQLIIAPMGGVVGLNLLAVDVVLRRLNIELSAEDFEKLLLLGREYVKAINKEIK